MESCICSNCDFFLSSKRVAIGKADFASFNPVNFLSTIFSATNNSNLPLQSVFILCLAELSWLHNCDVINRVEDSKAYGGQEEKRVR